MKRNIPTDLNKMILYYIILKMKLLDIGTHLILLQILSTIKNIFQKKRSSSMKFINLALIENENKI